MAVYATPGVGLPDLRCKSLSRIPFASDQAKRGSRGHVAREFKSTVRAQAEDAVTGRSVSRRQLIYLPPTAAAATLLWPSDAPALAVEIEGEAGEARKRLLDLCKAKKGDRDVLPAFRELAQYNPTPAPARSDQLPGVWRLVWASDNAEVSGVTRKLPIPATSIQLIGEKGGLPQGRAANIIKIADGFVQVFLSSAAILDESRDDTLLVQAPFYLEFKLGGLTLPIQDTQPGEGPKNILGNEINYFRQLYLESSGRPGDLRLSEVTAGNDRVTGSLFVHERVS